jgi:hypothetical protein
MKRPDPARQRRVRSGDRWFHAVCAYLDKHASRELLPAQRFGPDDEDMRADGVGVGIKRWVHATDAEPFQLLFATSRDRRVVLLMLNDGDPARLFAVLMSSLVDAMLCLWHPWPDHMVRFDGCEVLQQHGLEAFLCLPPASVGALARVAVQPRTPAVRGASFVLLMAVTGEEFALGRRDFDALLDDFSRRGRDRMAIAPPFHRPH